jgi:hypothetical protein
VGSRRPGDGTEDEKRRSGVKTHTRSEGVGGGDSSSGTESEVSVTGLVMGVGWMWNLRRPVFSIR